MPPYGQNAYRRVSVKTDTPASRLDDVFERCLFECNRAIDLIERRDAAGKGAAINQLVDLLCELEMALDFDAAPDLCGRLQALYNFMQERLFHANLKFDVQAVREVQGLLATLRDSFRTAAASSS